jgi:hypothetical protein
MLISCLVGSFTFLNPLTGCGSVPLCSAGGIYLIQQYLSLRNITLTTDTMLQSNLMDNKLWHFLKIPLHRKFPLANFLCKDIIDKNLINRVLTKE